MYLFFIIKHFKVDKVSLSGIIKQKLQIICYDKKAIKYIILTLLYVFSLCMSFVLKIRSLLKRDFLFFVWRGYYR
ncbi:hypothetical protein FOT97_20615 [Bacillus thuringiensis]|nr:hypothetical protein [Bacillus thuringiensis]MDR4242569.1 hypothetical protein [Bacillus thuringiensis]MDR4335889.1 hypothetical protein [Bacillus thuringiensis]RYS61416.1 hypothetical protein D7Z27_26575 [Bacillus thuringiensis]